MKPIEKVDEEVCIELFIERERLKKEADILVRPIMQEVKRISSDMAIKHRATERRLRRRTDEAYRKHEQSRRIQATKNVNAQTIKVAHRRRSAWSDYEDQFLVDNHEGMKYVDIATALSRTYCAIKVRVAKLRENGVLGKFGESA